MFFTSFRSIQFFRRDLDPPGLIFVWDHYAALSSALHPTPCCSCLFGSPPPQLLFAAHDTGRGDHSFVTRSHNVVKCPCFASKGCICVLDCSKTDLLSSLAFFGGAAKRRAWLSSPDCRERSSGWKCLVSHRSGENRGLSASVSSDCYHQSFQFVFEKLSSVNCLEIREFWLAWPVGTPIPCSENFFPALLTFITVTSKKAFVLVGMTFGFPKTAAVYATPHHIAVLSYVSSPKAKSKWRCCAKTVIFVFPPWFIFFFAFRLFQDMAGNGMEVDPPTAVSSSNSSAAPGLLKRSNSAPMINIITSSSDASPNSSTNSQTSPASSTASGPPCSIPTSSSLQQIPVHKGWVVFIRLRLRSRGQSGGEG